MKNPHYKTKLRHLKKESESIKKYRIMSSQNPTRKQLLPYLTSRPSPQKVTDENTTNDLKNGGTASTANGGQQQNLVK